MRADMKPRIQNTREPHRMKAIVMPEFHVSQIDLVCAITKFLQDKHGITHLLSREINTVIRCATEIVDELRQPDRIVKAAMGLQAWLASDRTGVSSVFMASVLGGFSRPFGHPYDPADFGRCVGLLDAVPEFRGRVKEMAEHGKEWSALVSAWDELEALYREELPSGVATRCYDRMVELLKA
jgi:hypothetical protein